MPVHTKHADGSVGYFTRTFWFPTAGLVMLIVAGLPARGIAQDVFENDNIPLRASLLTDSMTADSTPFFLSYLQLHSFSPGSDEDWIYFDSGTAVGAECEADALSIVVRQPDGETSSSFVPQLEIYPGTRFSDEMVLPESTLGDCGAAGPAPLDSSLDFPFGLFGSSRLIRIRNCNEVAGPELNYELIVEHGVACSALIALVSGRVVEGQAATPVQVFLTTDANNVTVSDASTGDFTVAIPADALIGLNVASLLYTAETVQVPPTPPSTRTELGDIVVRSIETVFESGFESL